MIPRLSHLEILCITLGYAGAIDETGGIVGYRFIVWRKAIQWRLLGHTRWHVPP
jgi:hypothetical protein